MTDEIMVEPISLVEQYVGRRWSIAMATALLILILAYFGQTTLAEMMAGGWLVIIGGLFKDYSTEKTG
jgi:hypothetical protein